MMNLDKMRALALRDTCPMCFGELDTGWECNNCGYDAKPLVDGEKLIRGPMAGEANSTC